MTDTPASMTLARGGCPCEGKNLEKLLRPAILFLLAEERQYGYRILQRLAEMPICGCDQPNAAGVYRCLKQMAGEGLIAAEWMLAEKGPAKRLYTLTPKGDECLLSWLITLGNYRQAIDCLLTLGQETIKRD